MPQILDHLKEEELEQYCLGGLVEARCVRLEEHLLVCEPCCNRLAETDAFVAAMRQASRQWSEDHAGVPASGIIAGRTRREWLPGHLVPVFVIAAMLVACAAVWSGRRPAVPAPLPFAVELTALRGAAPGHAPAGRPLLLGLDLNGLNVAQPLAGHVVDSWGGRVAGFPVGPRARLKALPPGDYFVRICRGSGELLREYALTVKP
jgi:hypothetical protein